MGRVYQIDRHLNRKILKPPPIKFGGGFLVKCVDSEHAECSGLGLNGPLTRGDSVDTLWKGGGIGIRGGRSWGSNAPQPGPPGEV